jgi:Amt family ammonium transporter
VRQADLPATAHYFADGTTVETAAVEPLYPMATVAYFQCVFAAITLILVAGSLLGQMSFAAWMLSFVPLWLTFSYIVGAFSVSWLHGPFISVACQGEYGLQTASST